MPDMPPINYNQNPLVPPMMSDQIPPQSVMPRADEGDLGSGAMFPPELPRKGGFIKWLLVGFIVLIVLAGGYTGLAYYIKLWPFSSALNKQEAFAGMLAKLLSVETASYEASLDVHGEARQAGDQPFEAVFPEFDQEKASFERDANRFRDYRTLQTMLSAYRESAGNYPSSLGEATSAGFGNGVMPDVTAYQYSLTSDGADYALVMTFETDQAIKVIRENNNGLTFTAPIDNKTVTFGQGSAPYWEMNFYPELHKPELVMMIENNELDSFLSYIGSDFTLKFTAGGTSAKTQDEKADARFSLGVDATFGDLQVAAQGEVLKDGDIYYGRLNKFPSFFGNISAIKEQWIKATPDDMAGYSDEAGFYDFAGEGNKKDDKILEQLQLVFRVMEEEKVVVPDFTLPDEMIGESKVYVYGLTLDEKKVVPWYERLTKELKDNYADEAIMKLDETLLKYMKTDTFERYMAYLNAHTSFRVAIDQKTGYPVRFTYSTWYVPSNKSISFKDKQLRLTAGLVLSAINQPVDIVAPDDTITLDEAVMRITGQTPDGLAFDKQVQRITKIRSALRAYRSYTGTYPSTLSQLTIPKSQLTKATGPVDGFTGFAPENQETPFMKTVPKDVFTGADYIYSLDKGPTVDDYLLQYQITLPARNKEAADDASYFGSRPSVSTIVNYANGANTATASTVSIEGDAQLKVDTDKDNLPDPLESYYGSNANNVDSDGDGYKDYDEVKSGYDPTGPGKLPYGDIWYNSELSAAPGWQQLSPPNIRVEY